MRSRSASSATPTRRAISRIARRVGWLTMRSCFAMAAALVAACSSSSPPPADITIALVHDAEHPARVRVSGLSAEETAALTRLGSDSAAWQQVLRIGTNEADLPVAGRYAVIPGAIEFTPAFPFDAGRPYVATFNPSALPGLRQGAPATATLAMPGRDPGPRVSVAVIYPSADEWPENLLRFYVYFSGPMARETGVGRVHLLDDTGAEVVDALLPSSVDFWSPDQTRYTVLFDPGRVKQGIQPNVDMGRALVSGRRYTIAIDAAWRDAAGRPLAQGSRRSFTAGPARMAALDLKRWRMNVPNAGSREALVVSLPASLDYALLGRAVGVMSDRQPLDGTVEVAAHETEWRFVPAAPWRRVPHELAVLSALEDAAGNRIGRAFEVLPTDPAANAEAPERFTLPVAIR